MIKTVLVVDEKRGRDLLDFFRQCSEIDIIGIASPGSKVNWLPEGEKRKLFVTTDLDKIIALPELEAVIEGTGDIEVGQYLKTKLAPGVKLELLAPGSLFNAVISSREQVLETRLLKSELLAILNAVQDAIEVVDARGIIKYVNPAFTRVSGIPESKRVNRSIFEVSPHGALAQALIQQKPVTGYRTYVGGSDADVISNASPIMVDEELMGAVVVFKPVGDILQLMDELKHSNAIIDNLYAQLDQVSGSRFTFEMLDGQSKAILATIAKARKAARSDYAVLISGECGSGKSLFAQAIHNFSSRKKRPLIVFDCSSVPDSLQEIELFGCERGAMPGILRTRIGKIELGEGSTLFFKEINSLNPFLQKKVVELLKSGTFLHIGGDQPLAADVRIVASTSENLLKASYKGYFSEELFRQLSQVHIELPPLRKRLEDIPCLAEALIDRLNRKLGKKIQEISPRALQEMAEYDWPGNISELKSIIERSMMVAEGPVIEYHHIIPYLGRMSMQETPVFDEIVPLDRMEEMMLKLALTRYGESLEGKKKAAQALNISLATLYNKLKKYSS